MKQRYASEFFHADNGTHWHSFILAERLCRPNRGCRHGHNNVIYFRIHVSYLAPTLMCITNHVAGKNDDGYVEKCFLALSNYILSCYLYLLSLLWKYNWRITFRLSIVFIHLFPSNRIKTRHGFSTFFFHAAPSRWKWDDKRNFSMFMNPYKKGIGRILPCFGRSLPCLSPRINLSQKLRMPNGNWLFLLGTDVIHYSKLQTASWNKNWHSLIKFARE